MSETHINRLKENRIKLTPKRRAIISFFENQDRCMAPETVWESLRKQFAHFGLPSVYRNLDLFEKCGILTKVQKSDRRLYYALCKSDRQKQHYLLCVECGKVDDLPVCFLDHEETLKGFKILNHSVQVEGVCPDCKEETHQ